ncbi:uncharacterized protein Z518_01634 [Rhinocladiella mackenziei CBS 650.93]|uniref:Zn(2)-C6 fungal-type domain-containing protein n=1 Tax=Rhinocladiella mackenziei CBS 650.93 TaxID=1442369 RepID=A0A0D2J4F0_9EURO|nr:uncharacterized protein Z518_01634 [Rhinocladiella mackenziei CBS 650.93]KIX10551.1 hypothetical protein Z518_01634 [Rhinocladiella mackenziei CBS 650.93]
MHPASELFSPGCIPTFRNGWSRPYNSTDSGERIGSPTLSSGTLPAFSPLQPSIGGSGIPTDFASEHDFGLEQLFYSHDDSVDQVNGLDITPASNNGTIEFLQTIPSTALDLENGDGKAFPKIEPTRSDNWGLLSRANSFLEDVDVATRLRTQDSLDKRPITYGFHPKNSFYTPEMPRHDGLFYQPNDYDPWQVKPARTPHARWETTGFPQKSPYPLTSESEQCAAECSSKVPQPQESKKRGRKADIPGILTFKVELSNEPSVHVNDSARTPPAKRKRSRSPRDILALTPPRPEKKVRLKSGESCVRCRLYHEKCDGRTPCQRCDQLSIWQPLCTLATFSESGCFKKGLYRSRCTILSKNIQRWLPHDTQPLVDIEVSLGLDATLPLKVEKFVPKDPDLLHHIAFRNKTSVFLRKTPTEAFGLCTCTVSRAELDTFLDKMIPPLIAETACSTDAIWKATFEAALRLSVDETRKETLMIRRLLRVWAAHSVFFGRIWRIKKGAEALGAQFHPEIGAADVPRLLYWQLDWIVENYMMKLESQILRDLEDIILPRTQKGSRHRRQLGAGFAVFISCFLYLSTLEKDSWNLEAWRAKSARWANDPSVSNNPTMVWPLTKTVPELLRENEQQAITVANHLRAMHRAEFPFRQDKAGRFVPNGMKTTREVDEYAEILNKELSDTLEQRLMFRLSGAFSEDDMQSLDYKFTRLILANV